MPDVFSYTNLKTAVIINQADYIYTRMYTYPHDSRYLRAYFLLAYAISWSIAIPLALSNQGIIPVILPAWTHYLVAFDPMLSALIVTGISQGLPGLKDLIRHMFMWRVCPKWWIVAFSPLLIGYVVILVLNRLAGSQIGLPNLGMVNYLPPLGIGALLLWILTFGLGEETGWRGYALPRLQKGRSALGATLILTFFWALWHLPQFFYLFDPSMAVGWLIGLFAGSVILTWLYNSTKNSILMVAIWHGCFNFITASKAEVGFLPAVVSMIVILWAVFVIIRYKPKYLMSI
jgi:membrane protease YdiL (CAAX protease family)